MRDTKRILRSVPWDRVDTLVHTALEAGHSEEEVVDLVVDLVDRMLPFNQIVPGPAGVALELVDGPVIRAAVHIVVAFAVRHRAARAKQEE
jgi:hypothetical protein